MAGSKRERNKSRRLLEAVKGCKIVVEGSGELEIDGEYPIPEKLTLGEAMELEKIIAGGGRAHLYTGLAFVAIRRKHPDLELEELLELDTDTVDLTEPPKEEAKKNPPARAPARKRSTAPS